MKTKKIFAALLAVATLTVGTATLVSHAEEPAFLLTQAFNDEMITASEMIELQNVLQNTNETYEYVPFNQYADTDPVTYEGLLAPTQHYLAVFTNQSLSSNLNLRVYFYLNTNIDNGFSNTSNYIYDTSKLSLINIPSSVSVNNGARKVNTYWHTNASFNQNELFFRYKLIHPINQEIVDSELELHRYTNETYSSSPTDEIKTNKNNISMTKCIYALGDANRDGKITNDDSILVMSYIAGNMTASSSSSYPEYDELAFELAADFDQNNQINILDVISINQFILNN